MKSIPSRDAKPAAKQASDMMGQMLGGFNMLPKSTKAKAKMGVAKFENRGSNRVAAKGFKKKAGVWE